MYGSAVSSAIVGYHPNKQRTVGLALNSRYRHKATTPLALWRGDGGEAYAGHHTWQQLALAIGHMYADIVSMCERIGLNAFFYTGAFETAINSLHLNYRRCVSANTADFGLGDGYLYLHGRYIKNIDNSLRGHSRLACINQTLAYDTANRSNESTISKVLLRYFKLRLCLSHLALYLYPLNLGQRSVVVQHLVSL